MLLLVFYLKTLFLNQSFILRDKNHFLFLKEAEEMLWDRPQNYFLESQKVGNLQSGCHEWR